MQTAWLYTLVFIGGGIGSAMRLAANRASMLLFGANIPGGTLFVNLVGCFAMGLIAGWFSFRGGGANQELRLFLTTGVLGGFTTFSAFALDTALLLERGNVTWSFLYVALSVVGSLLGAIFGLALMRSLLS